MASWPRELKGRNTGPNNSAIFYNRNYETRAPRAPCLNSFCAKPVVAGSVRASAQRNRARVARENHARHGHAVRALENHHVQSQGARILRSAARATALVL